jgi:hypothetical protein
MVATAKSTIKSRRQPPVDPVPVWIRITILAVCSIGLALVFIFAPPNWPPYKVRLIGIIPSLLSGFAAYFIIGRLTIGVSRNLGKSANFSIKGTGGLGFAVLCLLLWFYYVPAANLPKNYHINLRVLDERGIALDEAEIHTSVRSFTTKGDHLWTIDIPENEKPESGQVSISAAVRQDFLQGETSVVLQDEHNLSVTLRLTKDRSAMAIGRVVDQKGVPVARALVYVVGHEGDPTVRTGDRGQFEVPAHAGQGEWIRIYAEKAGYTSEEQVAHAGDEATQIVLRRK